MNRTLAQDATPKGRTGAGRILVGVDGSPASLAALRWSADLAHTSETPVVAVHAFAPSYAEVSPAQYEQLEADARERLGTWCGERGVSPSVELMVIGGGPTALLSIAHPADLLVLGTRGDYGFAHLHLGSVAHHLVHHTSVPLAIVPTPTAGDAVSRIVVGVDGSVGSAAAVSFTAPLARALGAAVVAVHAAEPGVEVPTTARVREWVSPIETAGTQVEVEIVFDLAPVAAICRAIAAKPETLAVVGTRGLGGFSGLRLGRVATHLVHSCDVPVALVPADPGTSIRHQPPI